MKFTTVALVVSFIVSAQAAPSIVPPGINADVNLSLSDVSDTLQRVWKATSCLGTCRSSWGWTGHHLGSDPYGAVLKVGDPVPYSDANNQANAPSYSSDSSSSSETATSTTDEGLSIQDVTLSAEEQGPSVQFSVYSVTRVQTSTSTSTSETPTTTSTPPPAPTTTTSTEAPPPPPPTTTSTQDPTPTPTPDQSSSTQNQNTGSQNNNSNSNTNNVNQGSTGSTSASDQQQYLDLHNAARAQHGASPVTWSDELEGFAQEWANNCQFMHSGGKFGRVGENLAAGTGSFGISDGIGAWMAEEPQYDPNNPVASHFTQVVWKSTTQIGCASATCGSIFPGSEANFIVCEYSPAGNVLGQFAQNVQK